MEETCRVCSKESQMESSLIARGRGRPKKTISETFKKDLEANGFIIDDSSQTAMTSSDQVANPT